jgi:two-component system cell cycle sensor histidine kinase/response regulator CckA
MHPDSHINALASMKIMIEGDVVSNGEYVLFRKDRSAFFAELSASCLRDNHGQAMSFLILVRDISDRKRVEEERTQLQAQLLQAQKMESIGRLAGGVAHDFNNMLSVILGYTELIQSQLPSEDPMVSDLMQIERAGIRARDITHQLLAFSRKQIIEPTCLDLNELIASTKMGLARLIGEDIDLRFCPDPDLYKIKFDHSQLDQILINLAVNARDAMPQGGRLTIETSNIHLDEQFNQGHLGFESGDYVMLTVCDDGIGMDKETLSHAFEPFFTTKAVGKGTGLGLATVYGIVTQGGGLIEANSEPGKGSIFKIYFPRLIEEESPAIETKRYPVEPGKGTVLVAEDDGMVRDITVAMLEAVGYKVVAPTTPMEALKYCENTKMTIDLLVTDVVMPELSGAELRDKILAIRPEMKVLFISGYAGDIIAHHGVLDEGINFIRKPFSMNELALAVRNVIQG